jgi:hypothetical protein
MNSLTEVNLNIPRHMRGGKLSMAADIISISESIIIPTLEDEFSLFPFLRRK